MPIGRLHRRRLGRKPGGNRFKPRPIKRWQSAVKSWTKSTCGGFKRMPQRLSPKTYFDNTGKLSRMGLTFNKTLFPNEELFELRANQWWALSGTLAGVFGTVGRIRLNDLAFPWSNPSGVNHDPLGVLQFQDRYKKYKVYAVTLKLTMLNALGVTSTLCIQPQSADDPYTFGSEAVQFTSEKPGVETIYGNEVVGAGGTLVNTAGASPVRTQVFSIRNMEGLSQIEFRANLESYSAFFGSSPSKVPVLSMAVGDFAGNNTSGMTVIADVIFHGVAFDRITPTRS